MLLPVFMSPSLSLNLNNGLIKRHYVETALRHSKLMRTWCHISGSIVTKLTQCQINGVTLKMQSSEAVFRGSPQRQSSEAVFRGSPHRQFSEVVLSESSEVVLRGSPQRHNSNAILNNHLPDFTINNNIS